MKKLTRQQLAARLQWLRERRRIVEALALVRAWEAAHRAVKAPGTR